MIDISISWYNFNTNKWDIKLSNDIDGITSLGFFDLRMDAIKDVNKETHIVNYSKNISDRCSDPHIPNVCYVSDYELDVNVLGKGEVLRYKLYECPKEYLCKFTITAEVPIYDVSLELLDSNYNRIYLDGYDFYIFKHGNNKWFNLNKNTFKLVNEILPDTKYHFYIGISVVKSAGKSIDNNYFNYIGINFYS